MSKTTDRMLVVTQSSARRTQVALWHDEGWSYPEGLTTADPGAVFREWRWIDHRALVGVSSEEPIVARLKLVARAFNKPRRLRISISLNAGRTLITLETLDGSDAPNTSDPRRLSFQVFRIELVAGT